MIPWPIALFAIFYVCIGSSAAVMVAHGHGSAWTIVWGGVAVALVWGLVFLKPWARALAVWSSVVMTLAALLSALMAVIVTPADPHLALLATGMAGVQLVVVRYLTRPRVRGWFMESERSHGKHLVR